MSKKNIKLIYSSLGAFMLVLLQTSVFQNALGFSNVIGIPYLREILFFISNILSFIGVIIFIFFEHLSTNSNFL